MEAAAAFNKILISPLPRYMNASCCPDPDHGPNIKEAGYKEQLEETVLASRRHIKDFAFRQGVWRIRVLGPRSLLRKLDLNIWPDDPFHMSAAGLDKLAKLIINMEAEMEGMEIGSDKSAKSKRQDGRGFRGSGSGVTEGQTLSSL